MHLPFEEYSYEYDVDNLYPGCSLGNKEIYVYSNKESNISGIWKSDNTHYLSNIRTGIFCNGQKFIAKKTIFAPAYQYTEFTVDGLSAINLSFIPYDCNELSTAFQILTIKNESNSIKKVIIDHRIHISGINANECCKAPDFNDLEQRIDINEENGIFIACNSPLPYADGISGNTNRCRIIGSSIKPKSYSVSKPSRLDIRYEIEVGPNNESEIPLIVAISDKGITQTKILYNNVQDYKKLLYKTIENISKIKKSCDIMTPEIMINRGVFWSKINTVRVQHDYLIGDGFTNMPPYDIMVARDASWYSSGCNYFIPEYSYKILWTLCSKFQYDTGQITEFIKLSKFDDTKNVYGISINDCTTMYMIAIFRHYSLTQNIDFLKQFYDSVISAAEYIISNIKDGLVFAKTPGTSFYGVVGWRNVLAGDHINGFVPELNAECSFALKCVSELAAKLGNTEESERYYMISESIKNYINEKLICPETGLYYLMIDQWGNKRKDITADLAVPAMFDIPTDEIRKKIIETLLDPEFWTPYGCRTVGSNQPEYDPDYLQSGADMSLLGGIWPNLAGWVAYASKDDHPEKPAEALMNIFRISEVDSPKNFGHVCPGEFPECLHGDTFRSLGMKASPWTPPSYLWFAMECLAGFYPTIDGIIFRPYAHPDWNWYAFKDVCYMNQKFSLFKWRNDIFSSIPLKSEHKISVYPDEIKVSSTDGIFAIGMRDKDEIVIFIAANRQTFGKVKIIIPEDSCEFDVRPESNQAEIFKYKIHNGKIINEK